MGVIRDWARCCSCGERALISKKLWNRAARPRCGGCGGPMEQSEASRKGDATHNDKRKGLKEQRKNNDRGDCDS